MIFRLNFLHFKLHICYHIAVRERETIRLTAERSVALTNWEYICLNVKIFWMKVKLAYLKAYVAVQENQLWVLKNVW